MSLQSVRGDWSKRVGFKRSVRWSFELEVLRYILVCDTLKDLDGRGMVTWMYDEVQIFTYQSRRPSYYT